MPSVSSQLGSDGILKRKKDLDVVKKMVECENG